MLWIYSLPWAGHRQPGRQKQILDAGADKVGINTVAVKNHNPVKEASSVFGSSCISILNNGS